MLEGLPPIVTGKTRSGATVSNAEDPRPFASKTIVVLSDGDNRTGANPITAAEDIIADYNVTIHTVTFTQGADQTEMTTVAEKGFGRHYHADTGEGLIDVFEEIANNLPTILTE